MRPQNHDGFGDRVASERIDHAACDKRLLPRRRRSRRGNLLSEECGHENPNHGSLLPLPSDFIGRNHAHSHQCFAVGPNAHGRALSVEQLAKFGGLRALIEIHFPGVDAVVAGRHIFDVEIPGSIGRGSFQQVQSGRRIHQSAQLSLLSPPPAGHQPSGRCPQRCRHRMPAGCSIAHPRRS